MNTTQDKRMKMLVVLLFAGLVALLIMIFGIYLFRQREVAPPDVPAAAEPIVTEWNYGTKDGDIWKQQPSQVLRFTPPQNFDGTVTVESQWGHSSGNTPCAQIQLNETHIVKIPGIDKTIVSEDQGDAIEQAECQDMIDELEALGYTVGPFNKPHGVVGDDSTFFPSVPNDKASGSWSSAQGDLVVNVDFTGVNGPPEEYCDNQTGTQADDRICNGSHMFRVRVIWTEADEPTPTPTATPEPSTTPIPSPTPTTAPEKANLGDFVWRDVNRNGVQDNGEEGLADVTVELYESGNNTAVDTTVTDQNGAYSFVNLDAGDYSVKFLALQGYEFTGANLGDDDEMDSDANTETGQTEVVTLTAGQTNNSIDAGMVMPFGAIGNCVWEDFNQNGIQDSGEFFSIGGVTVELYESGSLTTPIQTVVTTSSGCYTEETEFGNYLFDQVEDGTYQLRFILPPEYAFTQQSQGNDTCKDSDVNVSSGLTGNITIQGGETDLCWDAGVYSLFANIQILKSEIADHNSATDYQIVEQGANANFYITVINIGNVPLDNVLVDDESAPGCSRDVSATDLTQEGGVLGVGESVSYSCESNSVNEGFVNVAHATGDPTNDTPTVEDYDDSEVVVQGEPSIMIQKSEREEHSVAMDTQNVISGQKATFHIKVTNTGEVNLSNVVVTDTQAPGCARDVSALDLQASSGVLETGESVSYTCESNTVTANFTNTAKVTGDPEDDQDPVEDSDDSDVTVYTPTKGAPAPIPSLPATGILDEGRWRVIVPAIGAVLLGVGFVVLGGHRYIGRLISRDSNGKGVLD